MRRDALRLQEICTLIGLTAHEMPLGSLHLGLDAGVKGDGGVDEPLRVEAHRLFPE